jgi:uncharacterized RDD family membrane protein YckC
VSHVPGSEPPATGSISSLAAGAAPIVTPEAVVLDFERAGVASRTLAFTLDILALGVTILLLALLAGALGVAAEGAGAAVFAAVASLASLVIWFTAFETLWRGRTLGKAALGLRVVSADGTSERFQQAFLRAAVGLIDFLFPPVGFTAVVSCMLSPRDQRLGDLAAGTLVVRERSAQKVVAPALFPPPPGYERYAASLDVNALDDETYGLVRTFLLRCPSLSQAARDHLAVRIANPVATRMGHTPPGWLHPHLFLVCVAAGWQRAHGGPAPPLPPPVGQRSVGAYGGAYVHPAPPIARPAPPPPPPPPPPPYGR